MKQRRRLEITTFRRRTTVILRERVPAEPRPLSMSQGQRPMSKVILGDGVSTGSGSDRVLQIQNKKKGEQS